MMKGKWHAMCADTGMLLIRLALGIVFVASGSMKFMALAGTAKFFASLGLGMFWVYAVATVELLGGIALILGIGTTIAGTLLAIDMLFAIILAKFALGFVAGYRLEFVLLLVALGIAFAGPGRYSLHGLACKECYAKGK